MRRIKMKVNNDIEEIKKSLENILELNKQQMQLSDGEKLKLSVELFRKILNYSDIKNEGILYTIVRLFADVPFNNTLTDVYEVIDEDNDKFCIINLGNDENPISKLLLDLCFVNGTVVFHVSCNVLGYSFESSVKIFKDNSIDQVFDHIYIDGINSDSDMIFDKNGIEVSEENTKLYKDNGMPEIRATQVKTRDAKGEYFTLSNKVTINNSNEYCDNSIQEISDMPVDERIIFPDLEEKVFGADYINSFCETTLAKCSEEELAVYFPNLVNSLPKFKRSNTRVKRP